VLERRDRAVRDREDRSLLQRRAARSLVHGEDGLDQLRLADLVLDVLAGVPQAGRLHGQRRHVGFDVGRMRRRPVDVDLVESVDKAGEPGEVSQRPLALLAREVVEHVRGHAVAGHDERVAPENAVPGRVPAGEEDLLRHGRQATLDEVPAEPRREPLAVDLRAGRGEQVDRERRVVGDAHLREDLHGLRMDERLLALRQVRHPRLRHIPSPRPPPAGTVAPEALARALRTPSPRKRSPVRRLLTPSRPKRARGSRLLTPSHRHARGFARLPHALPAAMRFAASTRSLSRNRRRWRPTPRE